MIEVHEFPTTWGINPSPFCIKVEAYLKLAGIPYTPVVALPFRAPRASSPSSSTTVSGVRIAATSSSICDRPF
jgi:hypothetical protein